MSKKEAKAEPKTKKERKKMMEAVEPIVEEIKPKRGKVKKDAEPVELVKDRKANKPPKPIKAVEVVETSKLELVPTRSDRALILDISPRLKRMGIENGNQLRVALSAHWRVEIENPNLKKPTVAKYLMTHKRFAETKGLLIGNTIAAHLRASVGEAPIAITIANKYSKALEGFSVKVRGLGGVSVNGEKVVGDELKKLVVKNNDRITLHRMQVEGVEGLSEVHITIDWKNGYTASPLKSSALASGAFNRIDFNTLNEIYNFLDVEPKGILMRRDDGGIGLNVEPYAVKMGIENATQLAYALDNYSSLGSRLWNPQTPRVSLEVLGKLCETLSVKLPPYFRWVEGEEKIEHERRIAGLIGEDETRVGRPSRAALLQREQKAA